MNTRAKRSSLAANPVLIGAATVLIAMVAVVLAYNANSGLPFVRTYDISAEIPDAAGLIVGNDVRKGGARIGFVSAIHTRQDPDGSVGATIDMKLDEIARPLPKDSRIAIRPRSPLGLRYAELTAGTSREMLGSGDTLGVELAGDQPVELDDFFNMFDEPTRTAAQLNTYEFGNAMIGRGGDLNRAFKGLLPLVTAAEPALRNLLAPSTRFDRLFPAFAQAANEVAPVAQQQARMFTGLYQTFSAWASVREELQETIRLGPEALQTATDEFPRQAEFMDNSTELFRRLRPAFASLSAAAPGLATAVTAGTPALKRAPELNRRLATTLDAVDAFGQDPRVLTGLSNLARTATVLDVPVAHITPAQSRCNYITLMTRNLWSLLSDTTTTGSSARVAVVVLPVAPNGEGGPSSAPADSVPPPPPVSPPPPARQLLQPTSDKNNRLNSNPNPNTASPGQVAECEAGKEPFSVNRAQIGNAPGNQGLETEDNDGYRLIMGPVSRP